VTISPIPVAYGSTSRATLDAGGLQISSVVFPSGLRVGPHWHERHAVSIVLEGWHDESPRPEGAASPPSSVQVIPAEAVHEDVFPTGLTWTLIVEAEPEVADLLGAYGIHLDEPRYLRDAAIAALAVRVAREIEEPDGATPLVVEGLVLELLALLVRRSTGKTDYTRRPTWLTKASEYIHAHFDERFEVADVASAAGVHPAHLARVFSKHYGESIGAYVRRLRLDWAAGRLTATEEPIASIAYDARFANQSHFTRAFKRHTGLTPARFRRSARR
jgi:AraC family transcriptional regulator